MSVQHPTCQQGGGATPVYNGHCENALHFWEVLTLEMMLHTIYIWALYSG